MGRNPGDIIAGKIIQHRTGFISDSEIPEIKIRIGIIDERPEP
jgi:hypothetical protein